MAKRLFIGGLPYAISEEELKDLLSKAGTVSSITIIKDKFTGQGKGFGFAEYASDEEADNAVKTLNGRDLGGRKIVFNEDRPREKRPRRDFGGRGDGQDRGGRGGDRQGGGKNFRLG